MSRENGVGLFGMKDGERALAWLFFAYFSVLATAHYACKTVRQATYIDAVGADKLPWVYLLVALASFPVLLIYTRLTERHSHHVLIVVSCAVLAVFLTVFFWLFALDQPWVPILFYVGMTLAFGISVSQLWTLAHDVFDSRQARRLFAFIAAGGLLGGVPGGQLARLMASTFGTRFTLLAAAALMLVAAAIVAAIRTRAQAGGLGAATEQSVRNLEAARDGFSMLRNSRLIGLIALLMVLTVVVAQMVDLQFFWALQQNTTGLDQRTEVVGLFFSLMGILAFVFQLLFTRHLHRKFGVEVGMRVLPSAVSVFALLFALTLGFLPAAAFVLVWVLKLSETGFRHSIDQSTRELLFQPVAEQVRRRAKAFVDVFVQRAAKGVAALLLLPVTFGLYSMGQLAWATAAMAALWLWLTWVVRREYVNAYRAGLASGVLQEAAVIDPKDLTTVTTLVQALGSADPRQVLHGLELLAANGHGSLVPPLLLHHKDAEVRRKTLEVLGASDRYDAAPLVEEAVTDDDPLVRSGAMQTLAVLRGAEAKDIMASRLDDPDPSLRAAAVASLIGGDPSEAVDRAGVVLTEMATSDDNGERVAMVSALATVHEPIACATVVQFLYDQNLEVVREAVRTVKRRMERDGLSPIYLAILISLMGNRRLKHDAREALVACGEGAIASLALFMVSSDEQIWVRRAVPKTIAMAGSQQAVDALVAALGEGDCLLRSNIVDALAYLRNRQPDLHFPPPAIRRQIRVEMQFYLSKLADLWAVSGACRPELVGAEVVWRTDRTGPSLLQQLLALRLRGSVKCLFGLLGLIHPLEDVRAAKRSLESGNPVLRARALEYLDNTMRGGLRSDVFAVIDDSTISERLQSADAVIGHGPLESEQALRRLLRVDLERDPAAVGLAVAAAFVVHSEKLDALIPDLEELIVADGDSLIVETAQWVCRQRAGNAAENGGSLMAEMARIEMVVFLQRVGLFSFCSAEQVVQLAGIASERRCAAGEVIFRTDEVSDALYCIVEGAVRLQKPGSDDIDVGTNGRFGVVDILSGKPRSHDAVAVEDGTRLLTIEAEDFFDLLSNNIEIVRALFRQVISDGE